MPLTSKILNSSFLVRRLLDAELGLNLVAKVLEKFGRRSRVCRTSQYPQSPQTWRGPRTVNLGATHVFQRRTVSDPVYPFVNGLDAAMESRTSKKL
jgi:hypothetical protein